MDEQQVKRTRRSPEERVADIDAKLETLSKSIAAIKEKKAVAVATFDGKIDALKVKVAALEGKKHTILNPPPRKPRRTEKQKWAEVVKMAKKAGLKPEDIQKQLPHQEAPAEDTLAE